MDKDLDALARAFAEICAEAARPIMAVYATEFTAAQKADKSPVTEADTRAEAVILEGLERLLPGVPVIAEERFSSGDRRAIGSEFLLVDPLDGTKEFINKNGEFTINIGLIEDRTPVAGCVYAPAIGRLCLGGSQAMAAALPAGAAFDAAALSPIACRPAPAAGPVAVMSRSHADEKTQAFAAAEGVAEAISAGSSLKFCLLAEGRADLYPRFGPTMEWDTAAGHAVLTAAGGSVTTPEGGVFLYGKADGGFRNGPFIARGRDA